MDASGWGRTLVAGYGCRSSWVRGAIRQIDYQKPDSFALDPKAWRRAVGQLADDWGNFNDWDRFVIIQQVSSFLRTILVVDVESRLN